MNLPILNYHGIEVREGEYKISSAECAYFISKKDFRSQLEILHKEKYKTSNILELSGGKIDSDQSIMITFDDGHVSNYEHAWPILKEFGMHGVFFISTNLVGKSGYMDWNQIKELDAYGFDIGSHGVNHIPLTNLPDGELVGELAGSKSLLEDRLGKAVESFSVPRGFYNTRVRRAAESAGYRFVFTSRFGVNFQKIDFLALERLALRAGTTELEFKNWISGELGFKGIAEGMKDMMRSSLPSKLYDFAAGLKR